MTDRWKLIEYWFRRLNRGSDEHFELFGLTTTSLKLIPGEVEEVRATMVDQLSWGKDDFLSSASGRS